MKQFKTILRFELLGYLKNKIFVGVTVFLVVLIAVVMLFPRLSSLFGSDSEEQPDADPSTKPLMLLSCADGVESDAVLSAFAGAFPDYTVNLSEAGEEELRKMIRSGEAGCAFVLDSLTSYTYYVDTLSMFDVNTAAADAVLQQLYRMNAMTENGLSPE